MERRSAGPSLLAILIVLATTAPAWATSDAEIAEPERLRLSGTVLLADNRPAGGATVRVRVELERSGRHDTRHTVVETADDGTFEARGLAGEKFEVRIEAAGHAPWESGQAVIGNLGVLRLDAGHRLDGLAFDQRTGRPVAGAEVRACDPGSRAFGDEACRHATSSGDGRFRLEGLLPVAHEVRVWSPAHALHTAQRVAVPARVDPATEEPEVLEVFLGPGGRISGRLIDRDGVPLAGLDVHLNRSQYDLRDFRAAFFPPESSGPDGTFEFVGVPAGHGYSLRVVSDAWARADEGPFEIEAGTHVHDLEITLRVGATLAFRLVDENERPVTDFRLELLAATGDPLTAGTPVVGEASIEKSEDGRHRALHLAPGDYTVRFIPTHHTEIERDDVRLVEGETVDLGSLAVDTGPVLGGSVTDDRGTPLGGATVESTVQTDDGFRRRETTTDDRGRYRLVVSREHPIAFLRARAEGHTDVQKQDIEAGRDEVDFELARLAAVSGVVSGPDGAPPTAFVVAAHAEARADKDPLMLQLRAAAQETFTDPAGRFTLHAAPGKLTLEVSAEGLAPARLPGIETAAGGEIDVGTVTLAEGLELGGRVLSSADESGIPGAMVSLDRPRLLGFGRPGAAARGAQSSRDGSFELRGLEPGAFRVSAHHPEYSAVEQTVDLVEGEAPGELILRMGSGGALRGRVLDGDGLPGVGTQITVFSSTGGGDRRTTPTDEEGNYAFERLVAGSYTVMRLKDSPGFSDVDMKNASIREGETTTVDFDDQARIRVRGRVLRGDEALPGADLAFILTSPAGGAGAAQIRSARADGTGRYEIGLDEAATYRVTVQERQGTRSARHGAVELAVPDRPEVALDVVLGTIGISGRVITVDEQPVARALIGAWPEGDDSGPDRHGSITDAAGLYTLVGLEPGRYRVSVTAPGYASDEQSGVEVADGTTQVDFRLERGAALRGRVVDAAGRPVSGAVVLAAPPGSGEGVVPATASTDINGVFELSSPSPFGADVVVFASGWAPTHQPGVPTVSSPEDPLPEVRLERGGRILVTVLGADDAPLSGMQVARIPDRAVPGSGYSGFLNPIAPTDATGRTVIASVPAGTHGIVVQERNDVPPAVVEVGEGQDVSVVLRLP